MYPKLFCLVCSAIALLTADAGAETRRLTESDFLLESRFAWFFPVSANATDLAWERQDIQAGLINPAEPEDEDPEIPSPPKFVQYHGLPADGVLFAAPHIGLRNTWLPGGPNNQQGPNRASPDRPAPPSLLDAVAGCRGELVPFADGKLIHIEESRDGQPPEHPFAWMYTKPDPFDLKKNLEFMIWVERSCPPENLPLCVFRFILQVRLRITYADGESETVLLCSAPERLKVMKTSYTASKERQRRFSVYSSKTLGSWLAFIGVAPRDNPMAQCLFELALTESRLPFHTRVTDTGPVNVVASSLGLAAYRQERFDVAYEMLLLTVEQGSETQIWLLPMIKRCAAETGRPDVTLDSAWMKKFRSQLPEL